jgi:hypothetical protein
MLAFRACFYFAMKGLFWEKKSQRKMSLGLVELSPPKFVSIHKIRLSWLKQTARQQTFTAANPDGHG